MPNMVRSRLAVLQVRLSEIEPDNKRRVHEKGFLLLDLLPLPRLNPFIWGGGCVKR